MEPQACLCRVTAVRQHLLGKQCISVGGHLPLAVKPANSNAPFKGNMNSVSRQIHVLDPQIVAWGVSVTSNTWKLGRSTGTQVQNLYWIRMCFTNIPGCLPPSWQFQWCNWNDHSSWNKCIMSLQYVEMDIEAKILGHSILEIELQNSLIVCARASYLTSLSLISPLETGHNDACLRVLWSRRKEIT